MEPGELIRKKLIGKKLIGKESAPGSGRRGGHVTYYLWRKKKNFPSGSPPDLKTLLERNLLFLSFEKVSGAGQTRFELLIMIFL